MINNMGTICSNTSTSSCTGTRRLHARHLNASTLLLAITLHALCVASALAANTGPVTIQSSSGQTISAGGTTIHMGANGITKHPTPAGPPGVSNSGPVTIQGATVGAVNVGRKLLAGHLPVDQALASDGSPELFPLEADTPVGAAAAMQVGRKLSQINTGANAGGDAGGTAGTFVIFNGRKVLQNQVSNSGPVTIQGGNIGDVTIGH